MFHMCWTLTRTNGRRKGFISSSSIKLTNTCKIKWESLDCQDNKKKHSTDSPYLTTKFTTQAAHTKYILPAQTQIPSFTQRLKYMSDTELKTTNIIQILILCKNLIDLKKKAMQANPEQT